MGLRLSSDGAFDNQPVRTSQSSTLASAPAYGSALASARVGLAFFLALPPVLLFLLPAIAAVLRWLLSGCAPRLSAGQHYVAMFCFLSHGRCDTVKREQMRGVRRPTRSRMHTGTITEAALTLLIGKGPIALVKEPRFPVSETALPVALTRMRPHVASAAQIGKSENFGVYSVVATRPAATLESCI